MNAKFAALPRRASVTVLEWNSQPASTVNCIIISNFLPSSSCSAVHANTITLSAWCPQTTRCSITSTSSCWLSQWLQESQLLIFYSYPVKYSYYSYSAECLVWGWGTPLSPLSIYFIFSPFYFSLSFIGFTYFLLLSIPSLSTRIVPLRFQAGGRRSRPNLGLVCVLLCNLCYLYSLVKMDCGVFFYLV